MRQPVPKMRTLFLRRAPLDLTRRCTRCVASAGKTAYDIAVGVGLEGMKALLAPGGGAASASDGVAAADGSNVWEAAVDRSSGNTYYWNKVTRETTWKLPAGAVVAGAGAGRHADGESAPDTKRARLE